MLFGVSVVLKVLDNGKTLLPKKRKNIDEIAIRGKFSRNTSISYFVDKKGGKKLWEMKEICRKKID